MCSPMSLYVPQSPFAVQRRRSALLHTSHHCSMIMAALLLLQHTPRPPQLLIYRHLDIHQLAHASHQHCHHSHQRLRAILHCCYLLLYNLTNEPERHDGKSREFSGVSFFNIMRLPAKQVELGLNLTFHHEHTSPILVHSYVDTGMMSTHTDSE